MAHDTELILEQFRLFRNELQTVRTEMREGFADVKARLSVLEDGQAGILGFIATHDGRLAAHDLRMDRLAARVERIERRLEVS